MGQLKFKDKHGKDIGILKDGDTEPNFFKKKKKKKKKDDKKKADKKKQRSKK
jgi:hypothetical protein